MEWGPHTTDQYQQLQAIQIIISWRLWFDQCRNLKWKLWLARLESIMVSMIIWEKLLQAKSMWALCRNNSKAHPQNVTWWWSQLTQLRETSKTVTSTSDGSRDEEPGETDTSVTIFMYMTLYIVVSRHFLNCENNETITKNCMEIIAID